MPAVLVQGSAAVAEVLDRAYLAKRGAPWPPIPYDEIARRVAEEP